MSNPFRLFHADYAGRQRYFLTICTHKRRSYFTDADVVELVRSQFLQISAARRMAILAYCFMPDHYHAVVEGRDEHSMLPGFVHRAKQQTASPSRE